MPKSRQSEKIEPQEECFQVEEIIDRRKTTSGVLYLIKWKGFADDKDRTWEPLQHLSQVQHLVQEFDRTYEERKNKMRKAEEYEPEPIMIQSNTPEPQKKGKAKKQGKLESKNQSKTEKKIESKKRGRPKGSTKQPKSQKYVKKLSKAKKSEPSDEQIEGDQISSDSQEIVPVRRRLTKNNKNEVKQTFSHNVKKVPSQPKISHLPENLQYNEIFNHYTEQASKQLFLKVAVIEKETKKLAGVDIVQFFELEHFDPEKLKKYSETYLEDFLLKMNHQETKEDHENKLFWEKEGKVA